MRRKMISFLLMMVMLLTAVLQGASLTVWADNDGAAAVQEDNPAPAVAVYVNGTWCNVLPLSGKSGEVWLSVPIPGELLVNSRDNYVRVTSNVANGTAEEEQLRLYLSDSSWSNSFLSEQIWVDDNWTGYTDKQVNLYIEGWDGSQWRRIHDDIDAYTTDHASPLGRNSGGSYTNFARNIWVGENVVENYEVFRIRIHTYVGSSLATHTENVALFPVENYRNCDLCDTCGGCKSENCSLSHRPCSCGCGPAVRVRVGGTGIETPQWYGWYIEEESLDQQWVSIPVSMEGLTTGEQYQVAVSSNVNSNGNLDDSSLDLYATNSSEGLESFVTGDRYCDGGWTQYSDRNINVKLEGWNGHEWLDLNAAKPVYSTDADTTVLGQFRGDAWYNACRNIVLGSMEGVTAVRVSLQLHMGAEPSVHSGYKQEEFAVFLPGQKVTKHEMCSVHPDSCSVAGCPLNTCSEFHNCDYCPVCKGCLNADCTVNHTKCRISEDAALRVRVNGEWYGMNIAPAAKNEGVQWQYVPIDITKLNQNATNYIQLSSNAVNEENLGRHSVDVFFTGGSDGTTYITNDRYCDGSFVSYEDRRINMMLQFFDGTKWVAAVEESYSSTEHSVVGVFTGDGNWNNYARNIDVADLTGYSAARVAVQVQIGAGCKVWEEYNQAQFGTFLNTALADTPPLSGSEEAVIVHHTVPAAPATGSANGSRAGAMLTLRVNGTWYEKSISDIETGSQGQTWVGIDFPVTALRDSAENQFLLSSNVQNGTAYSGSSIDLFATKVTAGQSFYNVNDYYDDWNILAGYQWNMQLQVSKDGTNWENLTGTAPTYFDTSMVLGKTSSGNGSYAARNINIGDISGYAYARLLAQVHVGQRLDTGDVLAEEQNVPLEHKTEPPKEAEGKTGKDSENVHLKVRVNGVWFETSLKEYKGSAAQWVSVPVDITALRENEENYFSVSTDVISYGAHSGSSVDIYYTRTKNDLSSFFCTDEYCDNGYTMYDDRNINLRVELYDGKNWVTVMPSEETYYDGSVMLGYDGDAEEWSNVARNLILGDLSKYTEARVSVQLHVGGSLESYDESFGSMGGSNVEFDRDVKVTLPLHSEEKTEEVGSKAVSVSSVVWIVVAAAVIVAMALATGGFLLYRKRSRGEK